MRELFVRTLSKRRDLIILAVLIVALALAVSSERSNASIGPIGNDFSSATYLGLGGTSGRLVMGEHLFYLYMHAGQTIDVSLTGEAGSDFDIYLIESRNNRNEIVAHSATETYPERIIWTSDGDGIRWLEIKMQYGEWQGGDYYITWTLTPYVGLSFITSYAFFDLNPDGTGATEGSFGTGYWVYNKQYYNIEFHDPNRAYLACAKSEPGVQYDISVYDQGYYFIDQTIDTAYVSFTPSNPLTYLVLSRESSENGEYRLEVASLYLQDDACDRSAVRPGDSVILSYRVYSPFSEVVPAWLGARITDPDGRYISDPANDPQVMISPGADWYERIFHIPTDAPDGLYDIEFNLWGDKKGGVLEDSFSKAFETDVLVVDSTGPPAPQISSATHPNEDTWYTNNDPAFQWTVPPDQSGISGYGVELNLGPGNDAPPFMTTSGNSISYTDVEDGTWYLSVRAVDNVGNWGPTAQYRINIDMHPPEGSVSINEGATYTTSTSVTLTVTLSYQNAGVDKVRYSNDNVWDSEQWENPPPPDQPTKAWTLTLGDGTKTAYFQIRDKASQISTFQDTIILDTTPPTGSILINDDYPYTTSTSVILTLTYNDGNTGSGVSLVRYSNDGTWDTEQWENRHVVKQWALPPGDGTKIVYYQITDNVNFISQTYSDSIILDTIAPTGSITIADGSPYTTSTSITLTVSASDDTSGPAYMILSNDGVFDTEHWESYATSKSWTLPLGDGTKTVYIKFEDNAGLRSTTYPGTIILDSTPPTGSIKINNDAPETTATSVTLTLSADDANGVAQMRLSNDGTFDTESWEAFATMKLWTLTSGYEAKTVYAQFKDNAGLISSTYSDTANLVFPTPDNGTLVIQVKGSNNNPISGATVESSSQPTGQTKLSGTTNSSGYATFINVVPGAYTLQASKTGYSTNSTHATIEAKKAITMTITLQKDVTRPTISVTINSSNPNTSQIITFTVTANDNVDGTGIQNITLYVDDSPIRTWTTSGTHTYMGGPFGEGAHTYYAQAYDNANNKASEPTSGNKEFMVSAQIQPSLDPLWQVLAIILISAVAATIILGLWIRKSRRT